MLTDPLQATTALRRHLLYFVQALAIQSASSIAAAGQTIEQRIAPSLLMCLDRLDGNNIHLTHDSLRMTLRVRRAGITSALIALEKRV
ncbi:hypothetical protein [Polymorphobacter megasporae]|uniref:hypothetical protein n=1 Tax=Glacieibacterium megasporae TaxID=2835787 RepID=UPI001C1E4C6D|nr:hypothetical protein [Polymorphobacter megasporae]UAJ12245.1 hypothetical protein KTC28_20635 [Polymorphobacter megasporae]